MSKLIFICTLIIALVACKTTVDTARSFSATQPSEQQPMVSSTNMKLPENIVQKVSTILGVSGQPHFANIPHQQLATDCIVWELQSISTPTSPEQVVSNIQAMQGNDIDNKLIEVRQALINENVLAYKSVDYWFGVHETIAHKIVVCPSIDQFDILRFEQGSSSYSDSEYLIAELKKYDEEYGIDITGAGYSVVEFSVKRIPVGQEAQTLSDRILKFAPDVVYGTGEEVEFIDFSYSNGRVALWWD